jgi:hypothetical protein
MILVDAGTWQQLPADSERLFLVQFKADRTGRLVSSGGRVIALDVEFDYDVRGDELELRFRDSVRDPTGFRRTAENAIRVVRFELIEGAHTFHVPSELADVTYRWQLRFEKSPLPSDASRYHVSDYFRDNPQADPTRFTEFYGQPLHERRYSTAELNAVFDKWEEK